MMCKNGVVSKGVREACRALSAVAFMVATLALSAVSAHAQSNWWDGIRSGGSDSPVNERSETKPERKPEVLNDLRTDPTPLRSDVMLDALGAAIERFEKVVAKGGWPVVPEGRLMRAGEDDPRVPILRKRLRASGDLSEKSQYYNSETFDAELEEAVKRFQLRHGIRPTGRIERSVYAVLNVTAEQRLNQLKLNFDRMRALQSGIEDRYVLVNAASFELEAVEKFEVQQRHRVIVGRVGRDTPDVRTMIKALNFFPFWRVPDSVATLDLIPLLREKPEYLEEEGIRVFNGYNGPELDRKMIDWNAPEVVNYKFKQDPGDKNALGLVRIDMSNEHGVYMHDTPMKKLFEQRSRPFSAGCVRVQNVFDLVDWLARYEYGWEQPGQAQRVVEAGQPLDINLTRPVPVYFTYITAWAEPKTGRIEFRPDIYNKDGPDMRGVAAAALDSDDAPPPAAAAALAP
jgi:L,D-transpeptidase YcbB